MPESVRTLLTQTPMLPVITIERLETAIPLAKALVAGGIPVLEITLRTSVGLEAMRLIKAEVDDAIVGAGTVLSPQDIDDALTAGAEFIVTPGISDRLLQAGIASRMPFIPGISTASEMMRCREEGLETLKFFPAEALGGVKTLKALAGPFPAMSFCPTGGIGPAKLADYLTLDSVLTVGGSWVVPDNLIAAQNWQGITQLARETTELVAAINAAK